MVYHFSTTFKEISFCTQVLDLLWKENFIRGYIKTNDGLIKVLLRYYSSCQTCRSPALLFIVTPSLCQDWVIYAPAAFLGCGSRLSGSLSGIEPQFPVTRYLHPNSRAEERSHIRAGGR